MLKINRIMDFKKISEELQLRHLNTKMMIVVESESDGNYVVAYETHKFKNGQGYYLGSTIEKVKLEK